ncbi:sensor histidine kinase [Paludisphaera soli]|uniref:sensor histidine kinase n=1 Tax=Paludisphaera soli TaxID=2712865 RepID=UPI0013EC8896|nr:response regulator [Paludisphaera soli]
MHVLIADDDSVSRRLLQSYLHKWGYEVTAAKDGVEAWDLFVAGNFPMIITDWMMPELDGAGLIRRVRSAGRPGYVYTMLVTARSEKEDLVEGMEAGADDFLTKPFDRDELRVRLRAGERIIRLEQGVRDTKVALMETEKLASLGRLAAGVAHEINNPLAFVVNNLAVLRRAVQDAMRVLEAYRERAADPARVGADVVAEMAQLEDEIDLPYLRENLPRLFESSAEGLKRVSAIVQNLRDFARLDEAEFKDVDVNAALRSTLEALRHEIFKKSIRVTNAFQELPPVSCHAGKLNQTFLNLLLNAIQASEPEGVVEIRTRPDGEAAVLVEIEDHGCGIRPEELPHIFEPFYTTKPVGSGTGLGLSVGYGMVRDQGGSIEVESAVGRGSLFRVKLPVTPPRPDAESGSTAGG